MNLLRVNEEGDEMSDEGFDRDSNRHYGNRHDSDGNKHDSDGHYNDRHYGGGHGSDSLHSMPCPLRH
eukprot:4644232-Ditylum_brightwellii.AAC.1